MGALIDNEAGAAHRGGGNPPAPTLINLISKSPAKVIEQIGVEAYHQHCGLLTTPQSGYDVSQAPRWALDNGCFLPGYDAKAILKMLNKWRGQAGCIFAVLPDVVRNHAETFTLSMQWIDTYHRLGYPPAFVLQNGVKPETVPWADLATVFIGGDDAFKYSAVVRECVAEARLKGLWVHHGRVGGKRRLRYSRDVLQVNSFDSTGFSIYPPKIREWLPDMQLPKQRLLWDG